MKIIYCSWIHFKESLSCVAVAEGDEEFTRNLSDMEELR